MVKRMEKAQKKAAHIIENDDLGSREKVTEIKKLYKKAAAGKLTSHGIMDNNIDLVNNLGVFQLCELKTYWYFNCITSPVEFTNSKYDLTF